MAWDWQVFLQDDGSGRSYLEWILDAWGWTLAVAGCAWVVALLMGLLVGTAHTFMGRPWLVRLARAWVELFRNIPLLVQIFLWYFVLSPCCRPALTLRGMGTRQPRERPDLAGCAPGRLEGGSSDTLSGLRQTDSAN